MNNPILFWISFVGYIIFIIKSIQATIVLRLSKQKDFSSSEFFMITVSGIMSIIFVALSISMNFNKSEYVPVSNTKQIELHEEAGYIIMYDSLNNHKDTFQLYIKK